MLERLEESQWQHRKALMRQKIQQADGILHIGGHKGQEAAEYASFGKPVLWIEASPVMFKQLQKNLQGFPDQKAFCALLSEKSGIQARFHISNNADGASSSLFEFGPKSEGEETLWPHLNLHMVDEITLPTTKLDDLLDQNAVDSAAFNYWVLDVQGAEKLVLKGADKALENCLAIYAEISTTEVYKGGVLWEELSAYLEEKGFIPLFDPAREHDDILFARKDSLQDLTNDFAADKYREHTKRRQEHLASLGLDLFGKSVLELGAGSGDHSSFFLNRHCKTTITDVRPEAIAILQEKYGSEPNATVQQLDLAYPKDLDRSFELIYCYGLLYHLADPEAAIQFMAKHCNGQLLLETCVSLTGGEINPVEEPANTYSQSFYGTGCRPSREKVWSLLTQNFKYVYAPKTQPAHPEFPLNWSDTDEKTTGLTRAVFIASKTALDLDSLTDQLPQNQTLSLAP